jgi:hypothetical protein
MRAAPVNTGCFVQLDRVWAVAMGRSLPNALPATNVVAAANRPALGRGTASINTGSRDNRLRHAK